MATTKSFTTLEQSKVLAKILPLESADMHYSMLYNRAIDGGGNRLSDIPNLKICATSDDIPCWSLAALLGALPQYITKYMKSESCQKTFHLNLFRSYYHCVSYSFTSSVREDDNTLYCVGRDNWVDACYEMILKLNELNLL